MTIPDDVLPKNLSPSQRADTYSHVNKRLINEFEFYRSDLVITSPGGRTYHKFSGARKLCCNLPKFQTKRPKLRVFYQIDANGIINSEDPDQTAPLGAV